MTAEAYGKFKAAAFLSAIRKAFGIRGSRLMVPLSGFVLLTGLPGIAAGYTTAVRTPAAAEESGERAAATREATASYTTAPEQPASLTDEDGTVWIKAALVWSDYDRAALEAKQAGTFVADADALATGHTRVGVSDIPPAWVRADVVLERPRYAQIVALHEMTHAAFTLRNYGTADRQRTALSSGLAEHMTADNEIAATCAEILEMVDMGIYATVEQAITEHGIDDLKGYHFGLSEAEARAALIDGCRPGALGYDTWLALQADQDTSTGALLGRPATR